VSLRIAGVGCYDVGIPLRLAFYFLSYYCIKGWLAVMPRKRVPGLVSSQAMAWLLVTLWAYLDRLLVTPDHRGSILPLRLLAPPVHHLVPALGAGRRSLVRLSIVSMVFTADSTF